MRRVVHFNGDIIWQVTNLFQHELGDRGDNSRTQKPPVLDFYKKPTCLRTLWASQESASRELDGRPILSPRDLFLHHGHSCHLQPLMRLTAPASEP